MTRWILLTKINYKTNCTKRLILIGRGVRKVRIIFLMSVWNFPGCCTRILCYFSAAWYWLTLNAFYLSSKFSGWMEYDILLCLQKSPSLSFNNELLGSGPPRQWGTLFQTGIMSEGSNSNFFSTLVETGVTRSLCACVFKAIYLYYSLRSFKTCWISVSV